MEAEKEQQTMTEEMEDISSENVDNFFDSDVEKIDSSDLSDTTEEINKDFSLEFLFDLDLQVSVELARKEMKIRDILQLGEGSVIEFDKMADENVDIYVNNKKIAKGEVVVVDDRFGVRITTLLHPTERLLGITP